MRVRIITLVLLFRSLYSIAAPPATSTPIPIGPIHHHCRTELPCRPWVQQAGHSCLFGDGPAVQKWVRDCGSHCENQVMCLERGEDPNDFQDHCTPWKKNRGHTCLNESTGTLEQEWIRQCMHGDDEYLICKNSDPN